MLLHTKIHLRKPISCLFPPPFSPHLRKMYVSVTAWFLLLLLLLALFGTDDTKMRTRYKTGILNGILLPALGFLVYNILSSQFFNQFPLWTLFLTISTSLSLIFIFFFLSYPFLWYFYDVIFEQRTSSVKKNQRMLFMFNESLYFMTWSEREKVSPCQKSDSLYFYNPFLLIWNLLNTWFMCMSVYVCVCVHIRDHVCVFTFCCILTHGLLVAMTSVCDLFTVKL